MNGAVQPLRLIFMGTPEFALPTLAALVSAGHDIAAVYTRRPRPTGRGRRLRRSPVHEFALENGIAVETPETLRTPEATATFSDYSADAAVVVAYGLILPQACLEVPRLGCINVHASLLPRWRGAAPVERAIMDGDTVTGVSIMQMDAGLDTGPVLLREVTGIGDRMTGGQLRATLAEIGAAKVVAALDRLGVGTIVPMPQTEVGVTYAARLLADDFRIDWTRSAAVIERQVRALAPAPGAWCTLRGERLKVLAAEAVPMSGPRPGLVLDDSLTVSCGSGALRFAEVRIAGRNRMSAGAFLRGHPVAVGTEMT